MKAAIVLLTKGYPHPQYYQTLINRNSHIYENFNSRMKEEYPLLLFHEGNISEDHQNFILSYEKNKTVRFVNIGLDFKWPMNISTNEVKDNRFHLGYRLMCRFHSERIWKYVKDYDYILRIDEDALIGELNYDIFEYMHDHHLDYMVSRFTHEYHDLSNETLPEAAEKLLQGKWVASDYDQTILWAPYTNLYAARVGFFLREDVQKFLTTLTSDKEFLINRWGDAPVHGICLKAFSEPSKVEVINNFGYIHGSHHCVTINGRAVEGIMSEHEAKVFNCVPSGKGDMHYIAAEKV